MTGTVVVVMVIVMVVWQFNKDNLKASPTESKL